ncbi:hypothetical protein PG997_011195 [Apiospora hydei]|uniref:Uncharacterized protein n=1 Tax=Apiospora hydei TaxID=1337664 RepID=A0ABR1VIN0_9PEZI
MPAQQARFATYTHNRCCSGHGGRQGSDLISLQELDFAGCNVLGGSERARRRNVILPARLRVQQYCEVPWPRNASCGESRTEKDRIAQNSQERTTGLLPTRVMRVWKGGGGSLPSLQGGEERDSTDRQTDSENPLRPPSHSDRIAVLWQGHHPHMYRKKVEEGLWGNHPGFRFNTHLYTTRTYTTTHRIFGWRVVLGLTKQTPDCGSFSKQGRREGGGRGGVSAATRDGGWCRGERTSLPAQPASKGRKEGEGEDEKSSSSSVHIQATRAALCAACSVQRAFTETSFAIGTVASSAVLKSLHPSPVLDDARFRRKDLPLGTLGRVPRAYEMFGTHTSLLPCYTLTPLHP